MKALALTLLAALPVSAHAQHAHHAGHSAACTREHAAMGHCTLAAAPSASTPREPIPVPTDADRAAAFPALTTAHQHPRALYWLARFNHLELWDADPGSGQTWTGDVRLGGDIHRLRLATYGARSQGHTESADIEMLYSRSVTPWWDVQFGARQSFQSHSRTWAAFGVQGLAPYLFELSAMAYAASGGQVQVSLDAEYELLLTNRLILQPSFELTAALKHEPHAGIGSGVGTLEAGLRLRYEITRRVAPYLGLVHERNLGNTADITRANGHHTRDTRVVAGVRVWF